jgi:hypothetical protein
LERNRVISRQLTRRISPLYQLQKSNKGSFGEEIFRLHPANLLDFWHFSLYRPEIEGDSNGKGKAHIQFRNSSINVISLSFFYNESIFDVEKSKVKEGVLGFPTQEQKESKTGIRP